MNYSNTPVECIETERPLMIEPYGHVPDLDGAGKYRGGLALEHQYRLLAPKGFLQLCADHRTFLPYGLQGGKSELPSKFLETLQQNDVFRHVLAGAGRWGGALERDPQRVAADVRSGKLTSIYVRREYGVVVDAQTITLNLPATEQVRHQMRRAESKQA